ENQIDQIRKFCAARGWEIAQEFVDHGISGAKTKRPALTKLMDASRSREIDAVVVWRFDRFGRSTRHLVESLELFLELGVDFVSMTEGVDTSTSTGKLMFGIISAFAQFERDLIRERTMAGLERARKSGKRLGRPRKVFNRSQAERLKAAGLSVRQIAEKLGVSKSIVQRELAL
ncbi:MAG: recombinase family protein, partial [Candidatus Eisenbacteria bacterium]|nr:recombinase family protein [Candidatus Eisenbacteria bacterium]